MVFQRNLPDYIILQNETIVIVGYPDDPVNLKESNIYKTRGGDTVDCKSICDAANHLTIKQLKEYLDSHYEQLACHTGDDAKLMHGTEILETFMNQ